MLGRDIHRMAASPRDKWSNLRDFRNALTTPNVTLLHPIKSQFHCNKTNKMEYSVGNDRKSRNKNCVRFAFYLKHELGRKFFVLVFPQANCASTLFVTDDSLRQPCASASLRKLGGKLKRKGQILKSDSPTNPLGAWARGMLAQGRYLTS